VNALTEMLDGTPGFVAVPEPDGVELLPQAAATRAAAPTSVTRLIFVKRRDTVPRVPSCIPIRSLPPDRM
jgi:hypothetical protein